MGGSRGRRARREVKWTGRNGYRLNNPPTSPSPCPPLLPPPRPPPPHMPPPNLLRPPLRTRPTRRRGGRSLWKTANKLSIASAYLYVNNTIATCPPPVCLSTCLSLYVCLFSTCMSHPTCLSDPTCLSLSVCLSSACPSVYLPLSFPLLSDCLFTCLFFPYPSVSLPVHLSSTCLSFPSSVSLPVCLSPPCPSLKLSVSRLSVSLLVCLTPPVFLSTCLSTPTCLSLFLSL